MSRRWSYIRDTDFGNFYLLKHTEDSKFVVYDDDRSADGGFGIVANWEYVRASQVPPQRRKELSWIKNVDEEIEA